MFWKEYPRTKGKQVAKKAFIKAAEKTDPQIIISGAKTYALEREGQEIQYTLLASTWLNQQRWEDELELRTERPKQERFLTKREIDDQRTKEAFQTIQQQTQKELTQ